MQRNEVLFISALPALEPHKAFIRIGINNEASLYHSAPNKSPQFIMLVIYLISRNLVEIIQIVFYGLWVSTANKRYVVKQFLVNIFCLKQ